MNPEVLYRAAKLLATQLKMLDILIHSYGRDGEADKAASAQVRRQHVESKLRHLNHHIIVSGA